MPLRSVIRLIASVALIGLPAGAAVGPDSPACVPRTSEPQPGLTLRSVQRDGRFVTLEVTSRAVPKAILAGDTSTLQSVLRVTMLLPTDYDDEPSRRYPVLYLLHGHGGGGRLDWIDGEEGRVATIVGALPVIVVIPDGGFDGFYSNWYGVDVDGHNGDVPPGWETFHLEELIEFVDGQLRTIPGRRGRAIAGISMGGFGAVSYAARHPDLFVAAGSFSGALNTTALDPVGPLAQTLSANAPDRAPPDLCIWGDPVTQGVVWRDHDPTELACNLRGVSLFIAVGSGIPGDQDEQSPSTLGRAANESGLRVVNENFDDALAACGIPRETDFRDQGTHHWPYWRQYLTEFLPQMMGAFKSPPLVPPSVSFDYRSAERVFRVWDWTFSHDLDHPKEFTILENVGEAGFGVFGSGLFHVETARLFHPGHRYMITGTGGPSLTLKPRMGRLSFDVDLGPASPTQQYIFDPPAEDLFVRRHVRIHDLGPGRPKTLANL